MEDWSTSISCFSIQWESLCSISIWGSWSLSPCDGMISLLWRWTSGRAAEWVIRRGEMSFHLCAPDFLLHLITKSALPRLMPVWQAPFSDILICESSFSQSWYLLWTFFWDMGYQGWALSVLIIICWEVLCSWCYFLYIILGFTF